MRQAAFFQKGIAPLISIQSCSTKAQMNRLDKHYWLNQVRMKNFKNLSFFLISSFSPYRVSKNGKKVTINVLPFYFFFDILKRNIIWQLLRSVPLMCLHFEKLTYTPTIRMKILDSGPRQSEKAWGKFSLFIIHYFFVKLSTTSRNFFSLIFQFFSIKCHFQVQKRLLFEQESSKW